MNHIIQSTKIKKITAITIVLCIFCILEFSPTIAEAKSIKIGLSIADFGIERWPIEQAMMTKLAHGRGAELISQVANHDSKLQNDQIENMVLQGVDVIIIIAEDGAAAAAAVESAAQDDVPCIAYDRLIKSDKLAAYISFDNVEVGRAQARGVLEKVDKGNFVMLGGSPTDNNALLFRKGQMEIIQPLVDKGQIKIVADQWVENWSSANATKIMENILTAQQNNIDAVVASNDGTALGALQAMKAQGLSGKVPISGQDATAAGCKSIVEDELTMTVFKDVRMLSPIAIDIAIKLVKKEKVDDLKTYSLKDLTLDDNLKGDVPCKFLKVIGVDQNNLYKEIVKTGFQDYDDIYKDIPSDKRPPRPKIENDEY
ncbi:MAG: substrate-binding domain-containing protein [Desulfobacteraceae bacterium]|jgi:D-xylose transport system substrate-binding protein